ncbi:hypothetical protein [Streptomyces silvisoli]|uniref:Uncharacterized protein n=1 Tax=Streptomyces silvisoli TaxID=3034235 RepID=A0ABT5ZRD7_9ACTN|nr:hypothetical protein [Streptomyces silvisoli]MDF3292385.1 hypothetical protein [Streptomyces silvisoli]
MFHQLRRGFLHGCAAPCISIPRRDGLQTVILAPFGVVVRVVLVVLVAAILVSGDSEIVAAGLRAVTDLTGVGDSPNYLVLVSVR